MLSLKMLVEGRKVVGVVEGEAQMVDIGRSNGEQRAMARWMRGWKTINGCSSTY